MGLFEFIIVLVLITTLGKAAMAIAGPLAKPLADLLREMAAERRAARQALESGVRLDSDVVEELEIRLARIEDRLGFLEELRGSPSRPALTGPGERDPERGSERASS